MLSDSYFKQYSLNLEVIVTTVDDPEKINSMKLSCETKDYSVLGLDVNKGDPPIELPFYGACGASRKFPNDALLEMVSQLTS